MGQFREISEVSARVNVMGTPAICISWQLADQGFRTAVVLEIPRVVLWTQTWACRVLIQTSNSSAIRQVTSNSDLRTIVFITITGFGMDGRTGRWPPDPFGGGPQPLAPSGISRHIRGECSPIGLSKHLLSGLVASIQRVGATPPFGMSAHVKPCSGDYQDYLAQNSTQASSDGASKPSSSSTSAGASNHTHESKSVLALGTRMCMIIKVVLYNL
jgi:hypothetical protein